MEPEQKKEDDKKGEEIKSCDVRLEECQKLCEEYLNGWKRAKADFINHKKQEFERAQELVGYAREDFLESVLPMLDNLLIVEKEMPKELLESAHVQGFMLVKTQLEDFLKAHNVEAIDSLGKKFDPAIHEVIQEVEMEGKESGEIVVEIKKGYTINGRLLRPAKVKVVK